MRRLLGPFERSLALLNAITDGVIAHDSSDQLLYVNDAIAHMSGFESAEAIRDISLTELVNRLQIMDERGQILPLAQLPAYFALCGKVVPEREFKYFNHKTGHDAWLAFKAQPVLSPEGQVQFAVSIIRDITQRKQLEAQTIELLAERERVNVLRRFVSDMSHDFRTPLAILGSSLYLMEKNPDPEKKQQHVEKAKHQIDRMERLLSELLQIARLDEHQIRFHFVPTDINHFLEPIIHEYHAYAGEKEVEIHFVPEQCAARIDTTEFEHAFRNLMENAIAYTAKGGSITVNTLTQDGQAVIGIADTGIGIAPKDLPHIFERFYRADQARSTDTGGNGLGLSIVKRIIEEHQGSIEVKSELNVGTRFTVRVPTGLNRLV